MAQRENVLGVVGAIIIGVFLFFALRSCSRSTENAATSSGIPAGIAGQGSSSSPFPLGLSSCSADPTTGTCYPQKKVGIDPRTYADLLSQLQELRQDQIDRSSSVGPSSYSRVWPFFFESGASPDEQSRTGETSSSRPRSSAASPVSATATRRFTGSDSTVVNVAGGSASSRRVFGLSSSSRLSSVRGTSGGTTSRTSGTTSRTSGGSGVSNGGVVTIVAGGGSGNFGGSTGGGSGGFGGTSGTNVGSGGGSFGGGNGGLQGSVGEGSAGFADKCDRSRSLLGLFDPSDMTTGNGGWTFPVLLNGDCPVSAAILKGPSGGGGFGGMLNDF